MKKKTVATIVGARPQFIKAAAVSRVMRNSNLLQEILVHTGQHYDANMSQIFFDELELAAPQYHLNIGSASHGKQTAEMLIAIEALLLKEKPDWVLVYGDTNSTLAGALAAAKLHIPIIHVEAGLRSFNRRMPEEINRIVTDQLSTLLCAPTKQAATNLQKEGFANERIHDVGDVMYDVAIYYGEKANRHSRILEQLQLSPRHYILATIHRAENTDERQRLQNILHAFHELAQEIPIVMPLHPRTRKTIAQDEILKKLTQRLNIIDPVGFLDMVMLEKNAAVIATDSGGMQKEAFFHQIPCVTLRDETEWVELVELKCNQVVPPVDVQPIQQALKNALTSHWQTQTTPYGQGNASDLIVNLLT